MRVSGMDSLNQNDLEKKELELYRKNKVLIDALEEIPAPLRDSIQDLVIKAREACL